MNDRIDPAVSEAVSRTVNHAPPFGDGEWASILDLAIKYAVDVSALNKCRSLRILVLIGCDPVSTESLRRLENLRSLTIQDSGLRNLSGVCGIPLQKLQVPRNFVEDLTPLLGLARPCEIDVTGNPLSTHSYREVAPELSRRGHRMQVSGELPWKVTTRLHSHGIPVSCYRSSAGLRLCRPGLSPTHSPDYDHPVITPEQARNLLHEEPQKACEYFEHDELIPRFF